MRNPSDEGPSTTPKADAAPQAPSSRQLDSARYRDSSSEADELLMVALDRLAVRTEQAAPPADLETRLLAKAESLHLLPASPQTPPRRAGVATAVPVVVAPHRKVMFGGWPRLAWASFALAAIAALVWVSTSWNGAEAPAPAQATHVANGSQASRSSVPNEEGSKHASELHSTSAHAASAVRTSPASKAARPPRAGAAASPSHMPGSIAARDAQAKAAGTIVAAQTDDAQRTAPDALTDSEAPPNTRYSEFVPVGSIAMIRPEELLQTVRVRIGADEGWRLGLPVAPNSRDARITADFLVGEDGRARAVRLVSASP